MDTLTLLGTATGLGLAAGLRFYASVLAAGLAIRLGWINLSPRLEALRVLADDRVLAVAAVAFVIEFLADKVPWVDSLWDSVHTLIRPAGAALIGLAAGGALDPPAQVILLLLAGGVGLCSHSTKAGTRLLVNHSPEPFSNIGLSLFEDALAFGATWLALEHPLLMLGLVAGFLAVFAWLSPKLMRLMRVEFAAIFALLREWARSAPRQPARDRHLAELRLSAPPGACLRAVAGRGVKGLKNSIGYLCLDASGAHFVARRWFRFRRRHTPFSAVAAVKFRKRLLFDELVLETRSGRERYLFFKDSGDRSAALLDALARAGCPVSAGRRDRVPAAVTAQPA